MNACFTANSMESYSSNLSTPAYTELADCDYTSLSDKTLVEHFIRQLYTYLH